MDNLRPAPQVEVHTETDMSTLVKQHKLRMMALHRSVQALESDPAYQAAVNAAENDPQAAFQPPSKPRAA